MLSQKQVLRYGFGQLKKQSQFVVQIKNYFNLTGEKKVAVDGIKLNIRENGDGEHNVLCLPGLVGTITTDFGEIFNRMDKSKFRLISWDPPGYGKSRPFIRTHEGDFYLRDANMVVKLMDKLGYETYSVLGWSNGGMTAAALASEFPKKLNKLVMWGAHAYNDPEVLVRGLGLEKTQNWSKGMLDDMLKVYDQKYLDATLKDWADSVRKHYETGGNIVVNERCPKIKCPTLVLHGDKDPVLSMKHPEYFMTHVKNCKMHVIQGAQHNLHLTHTTEFLKLVEPFLLK